MAKKYLNSIGKVLKGKNGSSNYIQIDKDVTLPKGAFMNITPVNAYIEGLVKRGVISESEAEKRLNSTPDFVISIVDASYEEA